MPSPGSTATLCALHTTRQAVRLVTAWRRVGLPATLLARWDAASAILKSVLSLEIEVSVQLAGTGDLALLEVDGSRSQTFSQRFGRAGACGYVHLKIRATARDYGIGAVQNNTNVWSTATAAAGVMSSAAGFKKLGVAPSNWHHIQQLSCLRSFTAASIAPKRAYQHHAVAAHAELQGAPTASQPIEAAAGAPVAAYVHLPFCKRKCFYCDFPVEAVGLNVQKTSESRHTDQSRLSPTDTTNTDTNGSSHQNSLLAEKVAKVVSRDFEASSAGTNSHSMWSCTCCCRAVSLHRNAGQDDCIC
jgi:hypothetical protein